jgi:hypothetical protein
MTLRRRACERTLDLLKWDPPPVAERFQPGQIRGATFGAKIALAVAATLKEATADREEIAAQMTRYLGEEEGAVTENMLNAYASEARITHQISALRLLALCAVTEDMRLLGLIAEELGFAVVEQKYVGLIEAAQAEAKAEELRAFAAARRKDVR